ncbi:hypothetical protein [Rossellomorea sp. DUT-2]|uniref:hypothetical protein n=1 Tax=Rossellomorea sp. DUT-2 TaxID=3412021 RepID=UPI003D163E22
MLFPVIEGPVSNKKHAIKNSKVTECGIPYPDFYEDDKEAMKAIYFREVNELSCQMCKEKIENLLEN